MICYNAKNFCCEDISLIENYDKMLADTTQRWCCHHRREISEHKTRNQLIAEGHYYNRPASELIFMTEFDHKSLHMSLRNKLQKGVSLSDEHKQHISEAVKGNTNVRGMHWFNNGVKQVLARECPEGYEPGRLK